MPDIREDLPALVLALLDELRAVRERSNSPSDRMAAINLQLDALLARHEDVRVAVHGDAPAAPEEPALTTPIAPAPPLRGDKR